MQTTYTLSTRSVLTGDAAPLQVWRIPAPIAHRKASGREKEKTSTRVMVVVSRKLLMWVPTRLLQELPPLPSQAGQDVQIPAIIVVSTPRLEASASQTLLVDRELLPVDFIFSTTKLERKI
jgi:hypothetical protein